MIDLTALTPAELTALIAAANQQAAQAGVQTAAPVAVPAKLRVTQEWDSYNSRRYGRPWIAVIAKWTVGGRPELSFGTYTGSDQGGIAEVVADPGDIIRSGQKDNRGNGGSNNWYVVSAAGDLIPITEAKAQSLVRAGRPARMDLVNEIASRRYRRRELQAAHDAWIAENRDPNANLLSPEYMAEVDLRRAALKAALAELA